MRPETQAQIYYCKPFYLKKERVLIFLLFRYEYKDFLHFSSSSSSSLYQQFVTAVIVSVVVVNKRRRRREDDGGIITVSDGSS